MTHILLVGGWPELVGQLVGLPARVSLLQLPAAATGYPATRYPAILPYRQVPVDYRDVDAALTAARAIHREDPLTAVVGLREFALPATAAIARSLGLRCVPGPVSSLGQDKAEVRRLLAVGGCRQVRYRVCRTAGEVRDFAGWIAAPVVVKPLAGAGSVGVHVVAGGNADLDAEAATAYRHARAARAGADAVLAEEMVSGPEFSVETRSVAGGHEVVAVTAKRTTGPPHFVETGHVIPAGIDRHAAAALAAEAIRGLTAIGHRDGPSHVELIAGPGGPAIVEINRRIGGDRIWELMMLALDRNLMLETLRAVAGLPVAPAPSPPGRAAAIRYLTTVAHAQGPAGETAAGIVRYELAAGRSGPPSVTSSLDRFGYVLAVADTAEGAAEAADAAHDRLLGLTAVPAAG